MLITQEADLSAIVLKEVEFTYPKAPRPTLMIKDFKVPRGQRLFIYGPSGVGKTTLLEILSGVLVAEKGQTLVLGKDLSTLSPSERDQFRAENLAYIFQNFNLLPYLNVKENIILPLFLGEKSFSEQEITQTLESLVQRLGLKELLNKPVTSLSTGQQQRVAVARALLSKPKILFADEPTSSLDYDNRESFLKILFELSSENNTTVLFVSHDRSLESLFDRKVSFTELNLI